jgi:hypothetical protein
MDSLFESNVNLSNLWKEYNQIRVSLLKKMIRDEDYINIDEIKEFSSKLLGRFYNCEMDTNKMDNGLISSRKDVTGIYFFAYRMDNFDDQNEISCSIELGGIERDLENKYNKHNYFVIIYYNFDGSIFSAIEYKVEVILEFIEQGEIRKFSENGLFCTVFSDEIIKKVNGNNITNELQNIIENKQFINCMEKTKLIHTRIYFTQDFCYKKLKNI